MADSARPQANATLPAAPDTGPMGTGEFIVMIAALMSLNALAIDVMLPALDDIAASLGVAHPNDQQLVIYAYIAGFGVPQLVWGPLTDRFGRRPVVMLALVGYALMSVACMFAPNFGVLLAVRFCQGVFSSACRVVAVSIVRDVFVGRGMAKIMSLVMTIFMVVPILAPLIGQVILLQAPWELIFGVLTLMSVVVLIWISFRLRETLPVEARRPINIMGTLSAYGEVFRSRVTFGYMAASGVIFGSLFAFIGSSEQVFTEVFGKHDTFVLWFAVVAITLAAANFANSRLVERFGMRRMSQAALIGFIAFGLILLILMLTFGPVFELFLPFFALMFGCFGMIGSNFNAMAMEPLGKIAGVGSAAYGFATTTVASAIGGVIGQRYDGSVIPLVVGFVVLGSVCMAIIAVTERGKFFETR